MLNSEESPFNEILRNAVNQVFHEVLGEAGASFLYCQLQRMQGLEINSIPRRIEEFEDGVIEPLGSGGEAILNMIIDCVADELGTKAPRGRNLRSNAKLRILCWRARETVF
jgi:hypothetical protein